MKGETGMLTAAADDRLFGTENSDTFNAEAGTLQTGDQILDQSSDDNDTLNAVITNANRGAEPTLLNVENVNLDLDVFSGAAFDANLTEGSTITASSSKLGFNGEFAVTNAGDNNVVAGENVTDLTVSELEAGAVDTGAAEEASVTTVAGNDGEVANVTVNGDIALTVGVATDLNLTATADSVVDLVSGSTDTVVGSGEGAITLRGDATQLTGDNITGVSSVVIASAAAVATVDASEIDADLTVGANLGASTLEVATDANVVIAEEQTDLNIDGQDENSTVNVTSALEELGTISFDDTGDTLSAAELELTAANVAIAALTGNAAALTVNVAEGAEIADLNGESIDLVGAGDVVVDDADGVQVLDASGLDGDLEVTSTAAATGSQEIAGAVGANTVVFGNTTDDVLTVNEIETATFVGQSGNDDVTFGATTGNVEATFAGGDNAVTFGAAFAGEASVVAADGDDTLTFDGLASGADVTAQLGGGENTLVLGAGVNTTVADTFIVEGLTNLEVANAGSVVRADLLSGEEIAVKGAAATALTVTGTDADGETIDLSGLSLSNTVGENITGVTINGTDGVDTITGTASADTITGGEGADTLTGGAGEDTFAYTLAAESDATNTDSIIDFVGGTDQIDFVAADTFEVVVDQTITDAGDLGAAVTAAFAASADAGVDGATEALQFSYDSKTYFAVESGDAGGATGALVVDVTGVSGTVAATDFVAV